MLLALWAGFSLKYWNPGAVNDAGSGQWEYLPQRADYWEAREGVLKNQIHQFTRRKPLAPIIVGKALTAADPELDSLVNTYNYLAARVEVAETHQDYVQLLAKLKGLKSQIQSKLRSTQEA